MPILLLTIFLLFSLTQGKTVDDFLSQMNEKDLRDDVLLIVDTVENISIITDWDPLMLTDNNLQGVKFPFLVEYGFKRDYISINIKLKSIVQPIVREVVLLFKDKTRMVLYPTFPNRPDLGFIFIIQNVLGSNKSNDTLITLMEKDISVIRIWFEDISGYLEHSFTPSEQEDVKSTIKTTLYKAKKIRSRKISK